MIRVDSAEGVYGDFGDKKPQVQEKDPKSIKVFNLEVTEDQEIQDNENNTKIIQDAPHERKEVLKACGKNVEIFNKLVEKGYIKETFDGQYMISELANEFNLMATSDGKIGLHHVKFLMSRMLDIDENQVSDKQAKRLAELCGLEVVKPSKSLKNLAKSISFTQNI